MVHKRKQFENLRKMQLTGKIRYIDDRKYKTKQNVIIDFDDGFDCEVFLPISWKIKVGNKIVITKKEK